jgi:type I restriction enzyme R subunit
MNGIGKPECATQGRIIALFRDELGYNYLGDFTDGRATVTSKKNYWQTILLKTIIPLRK